MVGMIVPWVARQVSVRLVMKIYRVFLFYCLSLSVAVILSNSPVVWCCFYCGIGCELVKHAMWAWSWRALTWKLFALLLLSCVAWNLTVGVVWSHLKAIWHLKWPATVRHYRWVKKKTCIAKSWLWHKKVTFITKSNYDTKMSHFYVIVITKYLRISSFLS